MHKDSPEARQRADLVRRAGVPFSDADERRVTESVAVSLAALDLAVKGSLFDTEPQNFEVTLRRLAKGGSR